MIKTMAAGAVMGASVVMGAAFVFPLVQKIDERLFPVLVDWQVLQYSFDDRDLIVQGTMVKQYNCDYVPPPRARVVGGADLLVESYAPTAGVSWPASSIPRPFGPWRVIGGAGKNIEFYQVHRCHPMWTKTVVLGTFEGAMK